MKKFYLSLFLLAALPFGAAADVLLDEDFEDVTTSTESYTLKYPDGWDVQGAYKGTYPRYSWHLYYASKGTVSGKYCMECDSQFAGLYDETAQGPRKEYLITPELDLNGTYRLTFQWKAAVAAMDGDYDLQVGVIESGKTVDDAEVIWSMTDPDDLKASGVVDYPWTGWQVYPAELDLSAFQGKKVKIAFIYDLKVEEGNSAYIDDVKVESFTPITNPKPELSFDRYSFGNVYVGAKKYSEDIIMKNVGASALTISDVTLPEGFSITLDKSAVLEKNDEVSFQVAYMPTLTSPAEGDIVIKTNGDEAKLHVMATKVMLPSGYTLEGFEKSVPPAGWSGKGWSQIGYALEGDFSAYASVSMDGASELISPRLDLSSGKQEVSFTYYNQFESETASAAENDVQLEFSKDGGQTWDVVWTAPYETIDDYNKVEDVTVDLGTPASDNCYLKWVYTAVEIGFDQLPETSLVYLDQIVLPAIYGMDGVPGLSELVAPADGAENVYNKNIKLEWKDAMFATGYKLYVGSDAEATNLVNGTDLGDVTTYTIPSAEYATTYNWKVVPYNGKGDATDVAVWTFKTIPDCTVSQFPYTENFEGETFPALGWNVESSNGYTSWDPTTTSPYEGKTSVAASLVMDASESALTTPDFVLPQEPVNISFYWGNEMPVSLKKDETGLVKNTTTGYDGIDGCYFEILADGQWKQLALISDKNNEYWCREVINLSEYVGKKVAFRWRYKGDDYYKACGVALDMVTIDYLADKKAVFNLPEWNAGTVNYMQSVSSGNIFTVLNDGETDLKVASVTFGTGNFSSTLAAGTVVASKSGVPFSLTFDAKDSNAEIDDVMTVKFEGDYSITLPVTGKALGSDSKYYNFEDSKPGDKVFADFTTIDVDNKATFNFANLNYPGVGERFAFLAVSDDNWNNYIHPVSGKMFLLAAVPDDGSDSEDWIISKKMMATADSEFSFYARNYESVNSVLPSAQSQVEVLVSTTGNTETSDFKTVMDLTKLPYYDGEWENYKVDLSQYAGQEIYVALRHFAQGGMASMYDDFLFSGFSGLYGDANVCSLESDGKISVYPNPAADVVYINGVAEADVTVTSLSGAVVLAVDGVNSVDVSGLSAGVYLMTVKTGDNVYTERIIKK